MVQASVKEFDCLSNSPCFRDRFGSSFSDELRQELNRIGRLKRYDSGNIIISEGSDASLIGYVRAGVVRITQTLDDGRHQVVGLALPGDFFGCFFQSGASFFYEAATDVIACGFQQAAFEAIMAKEHQLEHMVMMGLLRDLDFSREWMMVLGCQNTFERVVSFMLHIHSRMRMAGVAGSDRIIEFPIGRRDIAGYLGTTVETISRHIQALARQRIIRIVDSAHFEILNAGRLASLSKQPWKEHHARATAAISGGHSGGNAAAMGHASADPTRTGRTTAVH